MLHPALLLAIQDGAAQSAPAASGGSLFGGMALPLVLCAVVFWFLVIGPERKQRKKREEMLKKVGKGDKVMTTGGIYGTVAGVQDDVVTLQVADGVRMRFSRSAVQSVLTDEPATAPEKAVTETAKK